MYLTSLRLNTQMNIRQDRPTSDKIFYDHSWDDIIDQMDAVTTSCRDSYNIIEKIKSRQLTDFGCYDILKVWYDEFSSFNNIVFKNIQSNFKNTRLETPFGGKNFLTEWIAYKLLQIHLVN